MAEQKKACLFLPETGWYSFLRGLGILGAALQSQGRQVYLTRCTGQMPYCTRMVALRASQDEITPSDKKELCQQCAEFFDKAQAHYGFEVIDLAALHDDTADKAIREILELAPEALSSVFFDDFPVSMMCQYDFSLETKYRYHIERGHEHQELYKLYVINTWLGYFYAKKIATVYSPYLYLVFNEYACGTAVRYFAEKSGALYQTLTYVSTFNADGSQLCISRKSLLSVLFRHTLCWPEYARTPIAPAKAMECWQDSVFRNQGVGSHVYSPGKEENAGTVFSRLELSLERKIIVALTSSLDEINGADLQEEFWATDLPKRKAFADQIAWLSDLREWAARREDAQVVVRIHPREGVNKNYRHGSEHLEQLRSAFMPGDSPNFIIVWPEDPVSSYDLLELAHACVIGWTSMGLEAARLGIPVLSWVANRNYVDSEFIRVAPEYAMYREYLDNLVARETTRDVLAQAVRYFHWYNLVPALDVRKTTPIDFGDTDIWPMPPRECERDIVDILEDRQDCITYTMARWQESLPADALDQEARANCKGIRLYVDSLFHPPAPEPPLWQPYPLWLCRKALQRLGLPVPAFLAFPKPKPFAPPSCEDYDLYFIEGCERLEECKGKSAENPRLRFLLAEDNWHVSYVRDGREIRRMSPLLIRLGRLLSQLQSTATRAGDAKGEKACHR